MTLKKKDFPLNKANAFSTLNLNTHSALYTLTNPAGKAVNDAVILIH